MNRSLIRRIKEVTVLEWFSYLVSVLIGVGILYIYTRARNGTLQEVGLYTIWLGIMAVGIYFNGVVSRMIHMSRIKIEHISFGREYSVKNWRKKDIGLANNLPLFMEFQYQRNIEPFISSTLEEYEEEEINPPLSLKVANALLKIRAVQVLGVLLILSVVLIPRLTNDYTLYGGLTQEQFMTFTQGIIILLLTSVLINLNYCMFNIIEFSMDIGTQRGRKWFLVGVQIFTGYVIVMFVLSIVMGIFNIRLPILQTIINPGMVNVFIVISPFLNLAQAFITRGKAVSYQHLLNRNLR